MADRIVIPARDWVGSVPAGCPLREAYPGEGWYDDVRMAATCRPLDPDEGIDLTEPPLDADGYPVRVDALSVALDRLAGLRSRGWPALFLSRHLPGFSGELWRRDRRAIAAIFAYRGPNNERAWEVQP